jgi:hypothetical protein
MTISSKARSLITFIKRLGRDVRGEDETHQSLGISRMGKVAIVAVALAGTAGTIASVSNNSSSAATNTSQNINSVTGATAVGATPVKAAFKAQ